MLKNIRVNSNSLRASSKIFYKKINCFQIINEEEEVKNSVLFENSTVYVSISKTTSLAEKNKKTAQADVSKLVCGAFSIVH